jgi:hypothetical protein
LRDGKEKICSATPESQALALLDKKKSSDFENLRIFKNQHNPGPVRTWPVSYNYFM